MNIFNTKKNKQTADLMRDKIPADHISKKKKNTYTVVFSSFTPTHLFVMCQETPLGLATENGKQLSTDGGWIRCKQFPNPAAAEMARDYPRFREIMGEKLSTTIIEYLDKYTGKPVVQVYPNMVYLFDGYEQDFKSHLNHASRRDFEHQLALRKKIFKQATQNQR